jgi:hypothetical protein
MAFGPKYRTLLGSKVQWEGEGEVNERLKRGCVPVGTVHILPLVHC